MKILLVFLILLILGGCVVDKEVLSPSPTTMVPLTSTAQPTLTATPGATRTFTPVPAAIPTSPTPTPAKTETATPSPPPTATTTTTATATATTTATPVLPPTPVSLMQAPIPENIIVRGDFETPSAGGRWISYNGGVIDEWFVQGTVDLTGTFWEAASGRQSVDLHGFKQGGAIIREFPTTPGQIYEICFAVSGNPSGGDPIKIMEVWWNSTLLDKIAVDVTGRSPSQMGWAWRGYQVVGVEETARLKFQGIAGGSHWGPVIDDVKVALGSSGCKGEVKRVVLPPATPTPVPTATTTPTATSTHTPTVPVIPTPTFTQPTVTPSLVSTVTPTVTITFTATATPVPTPTPTSTPRSGFAVLDPVRIEPAARQTASSCSEPQLPGQGCGLQSLLVVSQALIQLRPQIEVRFPRGSLILPVQVYSSAQLFGQDGSFDLEPVEGRRVARVAFEFDVRIPADTKAGVYGPIEFVLKLPDTRGIYIEVKRFTLIEKIQVRRALEMIELERFECGTLAVGQECRLFGVTLRNHASVVQNGRLDAIFLDSRGRQIAKPAGIQLVQKCQDQERKPMGTVSLGDRETLACDIFVFVSTGTIAAEVGSVKPVLLEP